MPSLFDIYDDLEAWRNDTADGTNIRGRTGRVICDAYAFNPVAGGLINSANRGAGTVFNYICGDYWDDPNDGYTPPGSWSDTVPFTGGQCAGVAYKVTWEWLDGSGDPASQTFNNITGPIVTAEAELTLNSNGFSRLDVDLVYNGGADSQNPSLIAGGDSSNPATGLQGPFIERMDGQPDTCGDPPSTPIPPSPSPDGPNAPWGSPRDVGEPGSPFEITPRPPETGPDGRPFVPIDTPTGTEPFPIGAPPPPGGEPIEPPEAGPPQSVPAGGGSEDVPPPPEAGMVCIGVEVEADAIPSAKGGFPGATPSRFAQTFGSVQLKQEGDAESMWGAPVPLTAQRTFVGRSHFGFAVVRWNLNAIPSWGGFTVTPFYVKES